MADATLRAAVAAREPLVREVVTFVHAHPELAHQEVESAAFLVRTLEALGLHVERGIAGMDTAFRATLRGTRPGRTVGLVANYDAVPSVPAPGEVVAIHACGHGPIAAGVVGAVAALADRGDLAGSVVVMGCPADEIHAPATVARGGGKAISAAAGAWGGVDAALYAHPEFLDTTWAASAWMRRDHARIHTTRSMRDGSPQPILAALDAIRAVAAEGPASTLMLESLHLDGDVEDGTGVGATAAFLMWAPDESGIEDHADRLRSRIAAEWETGAPVPGIEPDDAVRAAVAEAQRAAGRDYVDPPMALPFATDFAAITRRVPAALIGLGRPGGWAFHTPEGAAQFASEDGIAAALDVAQVLALSAVRLTEPR
jgi:metal-dependent amidase/aminoacylase/carboxypeptidase family protein